MIKQKNRQSEFLKILLITLFFTGILCLNGQAQSKIDYSIKSNILDPDTLKKGSNEYRIFWHFVKWTHEEVKEIEALKLKAEFEKIGITTKDEKFDAAYSFFDIKMKYHKRSVENFEHFKDLAPNYKKSKMK